MTTTIILALVLSILIYLYVGYSQNKQVKNLGDLIPILKNTSAQVKDSKEFSASTIATSISLATVIVAFFDLVPSLGVWLFWPVITTVLGFLIFGLLVKKIWNRMALYNHRPSLHEFLGTEFNSKSIALIGAIFTSLGYLSAFAVELTVGSRFLAALIPNIPEWITVIVISLVGFLYTSMGGFRTVVVTDKIQMWFIWLLLLTLIIFYAFFAYFNGGLALNFEHIPSKVKSFTWDNSLIAFIFGILIMNLFTYVSNMGLWQRISGAQNPQTVIQGMRQSVYKSALSWSLFVVIAIGAYFIAVPTQGENFLVTLIKGISVMPGGNIVIFIVTLGLYGAMLSTASTQLIAVSHTIYEDIIAPFRKKSILERSLIKKEVLISRIILIISALLAIIMVEILRIGGFSVSDLAFAIYGASLSLVPTIFFSLLIKRELLYNLSKWAIISVSAGFIFAWFSAIYGKISGDGNFVFWAPVIGMAFSTFILLVGFIFVKLVNKYQQ